VEEIDKKITALTLLLITAFAAVVGGMLVTTNTANAAETNSIASDVTTTSTADLSGSDGNLLPFNGMGGMMMGEPGCGGGRGFGGGPRGLGRGFMGGMGNIEISSEYTASVNAILDGDTDIQNLIAEGYNVTSIRPVIKNIIEADGTLTTKATTAIVRLQNGTSSYAIANVDVANAKVTQIVIVTRTVIDKTATT